MFTMDQVHRIRELFYEQGKNLTEIVEIMSCDWRKVRKYVDKDDFSPRPPEPASGVVHQSKIDCYKPLIDKWLMSYIVWV